VSTWTILRAHTRADGAVVRIERSEASRWQVSVRRGSARIGAPTQWPPAPLGRDLSHDILATFLARSIEPMVLPAELAAALAAVRAEVTYAPDESRLLDIELEQGNAKRIVRALGLLAARQRDASVRHRVEAVGMAIWNARTAALAALPAEARALLPLDVPASATRRAS